MKYFRITYLLFLVFSISPIKGQKSILKQADILLKEENYREALQAINLYKGKDKLALEIKARSLFHLNQFNEAEKFFKELYEQDNLEVDAIYYIGKCQQNLELFEEAANTYKIYLTHVKDKIKVNEVVSSIKQCGNALSTRYNPQIAYVENFGNSVNTIYDEIKPIQSKNIQRRIYFSSNKDVSKGGLINKAGIQNQNGRAANYDIYCAELIDGNYQFLDVFDNINTNKSETLEDLNRNGDVIYYLQKDNKRLSLQLDTFIDDNKSDVIFPITFKEGDKDFAFFNDSTLFFSSCNYDGYGGYDIYVVKKEGMNWGKPKNLGSEINSEFDEVSPYFTSGGNSLFYCSNNTNSLGGFDIFVSTYEKASKKWSKSYNLGKPINSPQDELNIRITNDGYQILFTSNRIGGNGGFDLYTGYLKEMLRDQLVYTENHPMFGSDDMEYEEEIIKEIKDAKVKTEKKQFLNEIYFYNDDEIVLNNSIIKNIKGIAEIFPNLSIILLGFNDKDNSRASGLFFTIKRLEKVKDQMIKNGINGSNIFLHSYGNYLPISLEPSRYNTRLEFIFNGYDSTYLKVMNNNIQINEEILNPNYTKFSNLKEKYFYKILFMKSKQMLQGDLLGNYPLVSILKNQNDEYEYYFGLEDTYQKIYNLKQYYINSKTDLKIQLFKSHIKLSKEQSKAEIKNYKDIEEYLEREK